MLSKRLDAAHHIWQMSISQERQGNKRGSQNDNRTTKHREHSQCKKTALVPSFDTVGPPAHTTASIILGRYRFNRGPGRPRINWTLDRHTQEGPMKNGIHLGRGEGNSPQQRRMVFGVWPNVSTWTRRLNQGQGQGQGKMELNSAVSDFAGQQLWYLYTMSLSESPL